MAQNSRTRFAILGLLTIRPMSGYDLRKFISEHIGHFWHESYGNIYPLIRQLVKDKLIVSKSESKPGRPGRNILSLTVKGRKAFDQWQKEPTGQEQFKSELLLKIFLSDKSDLEAIENQLHGFIKGQEFQLSTLLDTKNLINASDEPPEHQVFWLMTLKRGEMVARARLAWARESLETIGKMVKDFKSVKSAGGSNKKGGIRS